jgi:hypothetical protein
MLETTNSKSAERTNVGNNLSLEVSTLVGMREKLTRSEKPPAGSIGPEGRNP